MVLAEQLQQLQQLNYHCVDANNMLICEKTQTYGGIMKSFSVDLKLDLNKMPIPEKEFIEKVGYIGVFENMFIGGLNTIYPQGLPVSKTKTLARLQRRIEAMQKGDNELVCEETEFDLIKEVFLEDKAKFAPGQSRPVLSLIENIEKAKDAPKKAE